VPVLPGKWIKVRDASEEKVACQKLNTNPGDSPKYDTDYQTVEACQTACVTLVQGCNAVNFSPQDVIGKVKKGKCQFEYCTNDYKVGGTKHYDSWIYNGPVLQAPTTPGLVLWTALREKKKFDCLHLNTARDANPKYGGIYGTLKQCQDACANSVPLCNVINYAGTDTQDRAVQKGSCQFQFCNLDREGYQYLNSENYQAYVYRGSPKRGTRPAYTAPKRPTEATYDRDGWRRVGGARDFDLNCEKLNFGANYDSRNGPQYNTKYRELWECKSACKNQVIGCDAINFSRDKEGKCQFLQCNGKVVRGNVKDYDSYILESRVTPAPVTSYGRTRPPSVPLNVGSSCDADIDCNGDCDGPKHVDACGVCGGKGDTCTSYGRSDVKTTLNFIFPETSFSDKILLDPIKKFLPLATAVSRTQDLVQEGDAFTISIRVGGYSKATFTANDQKHLINYLNFKTTVAASKITIVDIQNSPSGGRRLQDSLSVDITVTLDVSGIHADTATTPDEPDRTPVVVAVVVTILVIAVLLVVGVVVVFRMLDKKKRERGGKPLEMELSDFSPHRKTDEYMASNEPVLESSGQRRQSKATVIVSP